MNRIVLTGRLVADPEIRNIAKDGEDIKKVKFRMAVDNAFKKDQADFFTVIAWRKLAEFTAKYFTKGQRIEVDGSMHQNSWEDENGKHTVYEVTADHIGFGESKKKDEGASENAPPPESPPALPDGYDPFAQNTADVSEISEEEWPFLT